MPLPPGLTPPEIAFLCEMELVTVIPRQRLEGLELLGVCLPLEHPAYASLHTLVCMYIQFIINSYPGPSQASQPTPPKQHSLVACSSPKAPTPRQHPPPTMAKHTLPHRNPRSRNRARRNLFSTAAPTTAALEQHTAYLTTVPNDVYGGCSARCATIPLVGVGGDAVGGCKR